MKFATIILVTSALLLDTGLVQGQPKFPNQCDAPEKITIQNCMRTEGCAVTGNGDKKKCVNKGPTPCNDINAPTQIECTKNRCVFVNSALGDEKCVDPTPCDDVAPDLLNKCRKHFCVFDKLDQQCVDPTPCNDIIVTGGKKSECFKKFCAFGGGASGDKKCVDPTPCDDIIQAKYGRRFGKICRNNGCNFVNSSGVKTCEYKQ